MDHGSLWKILTSIVVPSKITTLFRQLYHSAESYVRVNGGDSDWVPINSGMREGCVVPPELFNCVIDHLLTRMCEKVPGVSLGTHTLVDPEYTDSTSLFSKSPNRLLEALSIFDKEVKKLSLKTSWSKTELMHIGDAPNPPPFQFDDT